MPAPNVLAQVFKAEAPNQLWLADITYVATDQGWLYAALVLYLYSQCLAGWAMSATIDQRLTAAALALALSTRHLAAGLLHHSDRGAQYGSHDYRGKLKRHG